MSDVATIPLFPDKIPRQTIVVSNCLWGIALVVLLAFKLDLLKFAWFYKKKEPLAKVVTPVKTGVH